MNVIRKIKTYFETHFAASLSLMLGLFVVLMMFCMQYYLKEQYLQYLLKQSYETENAVLGAIQQNMQVSLRDMITMGGKMAVNSDLYEYAEAADLSLRNENGSNSDTLKLYRELLRYAYMNSTVTAAVMRREGIMAQYDRIRISNTSFWNEENQKAIGDIVDGFFDQNVFPRFQVVLSPGVHPGHSDCRVFHVVYPLTGGKVSIWETNYLLILTYDMEMLSEFVDSINIPKVEYVQGYIADDSGILVYHDDASLIGTREEDFLNMYQNRMGVENQITKEVGYFNWKIGAVIDEAAMQKHIDEIYNRANRFLMCLFLMAVLVLIVWFYKLMRPVHRLSESMRRVETGNMHSKIQVEGKHEIWQVAEEYNRMIDAIELKNQEIEEQHQETLQSIHHQHMAEWEALESQINAHFICNTLGCINYEAIEEGNEKVSVLIKKLSNILRYSFDQKSQEVYICQEIAWIDQYLYLQKYRMETVFDYQIDFPEVYGQWPCCKLMFQPFVENSILHGFEGRAEGGYIWIHGEMDGERLKITIEDNGCGIGEETEKVLQQILKERGTMSLEWEHDQEEHTKRHGIGIRNVIARMKMYYGNRFEVFLDTRPGEGTKFTFLIPIPEGETAEDEEEEF